MVKDDSQQLIDHEGDQGIYRITTTAIDNANYSPLTQPGPVYYKRLFESRGILHVIASTLIATLILLIFLYLHIWYTSSVFTNDKTENEIIEYNFSTWETSYDLPDEVPLLELHPSTFDFNLGCPVGRFALVLYLDTPISTFEKWMSNCGSHVAYFRMNGEPEIDDVDKIIKFVPTAQYIPIKANLHVAKGHDILSDPNFQNSVEFEGTIVNSLTISGYLTSEMLKEVLRISPFVEQLTIQGPEVCSTLVRLPKLSKESCEMSWTELRKLKINGVGECLRTYEFLDMCWAVPRIEYLEITESQITNVNTEYIENFIDKYRITRANFKSNTCSEYTQLSHEYICRD